MKNIILTISIYFSLFIPSFAQITLEFPFTRMVFQRNLENKGEIFISGYTIPKVDSVTVQLVPIVSEGEETQGEKKCNILRNKNNLFFSIIIKSSSGWYNLIVRNYRNNKIVNTHQLDKVGIGDVFLVAGQSNAQGNGERNPPSSIDKYQRVSTLFGNSTTLDILSNFNFEPLLSFSPVFPTGHTSWCYGLLGDMLVQRNNVPILFLNASWGGTSSTDWAMSVENTSKHTINRPDFPYNLLAKTLQFYGNITGFRAILWHQGEFDTLFPPTDSYFNNISKVISATRKQVGFQLPWVVSEVSYILEKTSPSVISDQKRLAKEVEQVYSGPATDGFINARSDGIHFSNEPGYNGLTLLAQAWEKALSPSFFRQAEPLLPNFEIPTYLNENDENTSPIDFIPASFNGSFESFLFIQSMNGNHFVSPKISHDLYLQK